MKQYLFLSFTLLLLASCSTNKEVNITNVDGYDHPSMENGTDIEFKTFNIVKLEKRDDACLSYISKIDFIDSLIIVKDLNGVFAFTESGKYKCRYGTKGHGAGEYVNIAAVWIDKEKKRICIADDYTKKILSFDLSGNLVETQKSKDDNWFLVFTCDQIGQNKLFSSKFMYKEVNTAFSVIDLSTNQSMEVASYKMQTENTAERSGIHPYSLYGNTIKYVLPFDNKIYSYDTGNSNIAFEVNTTKNVLSESQLSDIKNYNIGVFTKFLYSSEDTFIGFTDIFETSSHILLGFLNYSYFLVNKNNGTGRLYEYGAYETIAKLPLLNICATKGDYLVGTLSPEALSVMDFGTSDDINLKKLSQAALSVKDDDNPLLLFYQLR